MRMMLMMLMMLMAMMMMMMMMMMMIMMMLIMSTGRVGPPVRGVRIRLVNWEEGNYRVTDKPRPRGEILISGGNVTAGYYKQPEKTAEEYIVDEAGDRWFR